MNVRIKVGLNVLEGIGHSSNFVGVSTMIKFFYNFDHLDRKSVV